MTPLEERRQLIQRLKDYFDGKTEDPALDEYEITEAFDYAEDNNDVSLQERIMGYGLRKYPDFEPLLARNVLLLYDLGEKNKAAQTAARISPDSILASVYRVLVEIDSGSPADKIQAMLDDILKIHKKFGDEEMIKFVDTAMETTDGYSWLVSRLPSLREHTDYLPTLLFEMAQNAKEENRLDDAEAFVEELTMIEPFEIDFWEMLAEIHLSAQQLDKADNDIEYALAIDPKSSRSRLLKANLRLMKGDDVETVISSINDLIFSETLEAFPLYLAIASLDAAGKQQKATSFLIRYLEMFPQSREAIDYLLMRPEDTIPPAENGGSLTGLVLEKFYETNDDNSENFWQTWAGGHYVNGNYAGVVKILTVYSSHCVLEDPLLLLQSLYFTNHAGDAVDLIISMGLLAAPQRRGENPIAHALVCLIFIMGMLRTGNDAIALRVLELEIQTCTSAMSTGDTSTNMALYGYREILRSIRRAAKKGEYPDEYDPLLMPNNLNKKRGRKPE